MRGEKLRINAFYGFFQGFQVDTTMGLDQTIFKHMKTWCNTYIKLVLIEMKQQSN
jgi:hypothetical protein